MNPQVDVLSGPARAGKTHDLLLRYLEALRSTPVTSAGRCLWIAPTARTASSVREALALHGQAFFAPGITTFDSLAQNILLAAGRRVRAVSRAAQRELLRQTIRRALDNNRLQFFAGAARRAGFVDLLAEYIRELRQRDIHPDACERVAATRGQPAERRELSLLYADYDRQLNAHNLCDTELMQWIARDALGAGPCGHFAKLTQIVVDGFTDFTRIETELLRLLASRSDNLSISLPTDTAAENPRLDLFAKTTATLADLSREFPRLKERRLLARPSQTPALNHISEQIFRYPHIKPGKAVINSLASVRIIEAASSQDEITQLAHQIKRLLTTIPLPDREGQGEGPAHHSPSPNDIVVIFRSLTDVSPRIEETFTRHGIPFALDARPRIASSPIFRTLSSLLQLDAEDWPFRSVISIITNNLLSAIDEPARRAADWLIRDLQIASGHDALLEAIARLATQPIDATDISDHYRHRIESAIAALPAVKLVADALDQLPTTATANEWSLAIEQLILQLGLTAPANAADLAVQQSLVSHLAEIERLDQWLEQPAQKLSRQELLALLVDIGSHESLPRAHDDVGRVRILAAPAARNIAVRHVFLAGMSEQAFPAGAGSARLADDNDYRFLSNAAHQIESPVAGAQSPSPASGRAQDEMLLFYEVISRATESLTISYAAMDDKAQELPPSPYVIELQRLFRGSKGAIQTTKPRLSPIPSRDSISSIRDWRIAALAQASKTDGDRRLLAGLISHPSTKPLAQSIDAGVRITHARAHGETFGPAEGVLMSPAVTDRLTKRFGGKHSWSPSQFETYAACPYKFFLEQVLGLEPLGDLTLETDFARRGSLLHHVLATFHRKYGDDAGNWSTVFRDEARFTTEIKQALQAAIDASPREGIEAALLELDRRQIDKWTDLYHAQHDKYDSAWTKSPDISEPPSPTHFELRFGRKHPGEKGYEDPRSTDKPFPLEIDDGKETINVVGRIDRIDVGAAGGQTIFNVIDYKSGRRPTLTTEKIESGERLQPALYVMAAQALIFDKNSVPLWSGYWSMQSGVTTRKDFSLYCSVDGQKSDDWELLQEKVKARIGEIVRGARHGDFQVDSCDPHCTTFCEFKTICRIAQVRTTNKIPAPLDS